MIKNNDSDKTVTNFNNKIPEEDTLKPNKKYYDDDEEETLIPNSVPNNFGEDKTLIPNSIPDNFGEDKTLIPNSVPDNLGEDKTLIPNSVPDKPQKNKVSSIISAFKDVEESTDIPKSTPERTVIAPNVTSDNYEEYEESTFILSTPQESTNFTNIINSSENLTIFTRIKSHKNIFFTIISILIFLTLIIVSLQIYNSNKQELLKKEREEESLKLKALVNDLYFLGINEYRLQKWQSATDYFTKAIKLKPDYTKAIEYQKKSIEEDKYGRIFKKAKSFFLEKDYENTVKELKKIKQTSFYYSKATELKSKIKETKAKEIENKEDEKIKQELEEEFKKDIENENDINVTIKKKTYRRPKRHTTKNKKAKKVRKEPSLKAKEKAKELYISAYQKENRYPKSAKRNYKKIMLLLLPSDPLYQRAKKRLAKLK